MTFFQHRVFSNMPITVFGIALAASMILLTGCDSGGGMDEDENSSPVADIALSPQATVSAGTEVTLDASGSTDRDNDPISYSWSLSAPSGSGSTLSSTSLATVRVTPDVTGDYTATLTVKDENGGEDNASVTITAEQPSLVEVSNHITSSTTWKAGTTYRVVSDVSIVNDATLTIEPGTRVEFQADAGLDVDGNGAALAADGESGNTILMTGTQTNAGFWEGISFYSDNANNVLNYVTVEYGGSERSGYMDANGAVSLNNNASVKITNSTIKNSGDFGIAVDPGADLPGFASNALTSNDGAPMRIPATLYGAPDTGSDYTGNTDDYIDVYSAAINEDVTIAAIGVPYQVFDQHTIAETATLTISAGVTMEFNASGALYVDGNNAALVVSGTSSDIVTLTGVNAAPGAWQGIGVASNNPSNSISHAVIDYSGGARLSYIDEAAAVALNNSAEIEIKNTTIRNSDGYGIHVDPHGRLPGFSSNLFESNADAPVSLSALAMSDLDSNSSFSSNPNAFIRVYDQNMTNDATIEALDVPYRIFDHPSVTDNAFVTVNAGVSMEFYSGASLDASDDGALAFEGTQTNRITLTGVQTPTDGGYWNGIGFYSADTRNEMKYTDVSYGGADRLGYIDAAANVAVNNGARLTIENTALNYSGNYGGYADEGTGADVTYSNNSTTGNDGPDNNWQ